MFRSFSMRNYITFELKKPRCLIPIVFLDSFQFLQTSLEKSAKSLEASQVFKLKENFPINTDLEMFTKKKGLQVKI